MTRMYASRYKDAVQVGISIRDVGVRHFSTLCSEQLDHYSEHPMASSFHSYQDTKPYSTP